MGTVLLVGKGKLFKSLKDSLSASRTERSNVNIVDYEEEWLEPTNKLEESYLFLINQSELHNVVYLFPNSLCDGMKLVRIYSALKPFRLFVVTHDSQYSSLYKKMGANFVILSRSGCYSYNWLLTSDEEVFSM